MLCRNIMDSYERISVTQGSQERDIQAETFRKHSRKSISGKEIPDKVNASVLKREEGSTMRSECMRVAGVT